MRKALPVLLCAAVLVACRIPDLKPFSDATAEMVTVLRQGFEQTRVSMINAAETASDSAPFQSRLNQLDERWKPTRKALSALVAYSDSLAVVAEAGKKGGLIEEAGRRLVQANQAPVERSIVPLHRIQGTTVDGEDRLMEEGISDATGLAFADPFALVRKTTYARRQVAAWMDEALLLVTLPPALYEQIRVLGVTGAIDLAWYATNTEGPAALAESAKIAEATLRDTARRLYPDAQVRIVWMMYQNDSEAEPDPIVRDGSWESGTRDAQAVPAH
jgi:hypothetical protein